MSLDPTEIAKLVPLNKKATPIQIVGLFCAMAMLVSAGWYASSSVKKYFDDAHNQILAELTTVAKPLGERMASVEKKADANAASITALQIYKVSNSEMQDWTRQLDKQNREAGKALSVPDFPQPSSKSYP